MHNHANQRAIAASTSTDGKTLLVVIERDEINNEDDIESQRTFVCRFSVEELENAFEQLWSTCQKVESTKWQTKVFLKSQKIQKHFKAMRRSNARPSMFHVFLGT